MDEAKKEAREILADDGKPKEEITIKLPDIPIIRKGDKIHLKTASISAGYYIVISATHDVDKMLMTLGLKKAPAAKKSSGNKKTKAKSYDVGDIVNFHGGKNAAGNQLKNYLKEAETGIVGNRKISWKQISKSSVDTKRLKTEKPDIYNDYLTQSQYRRLSVA